MKSINITFTPARMRTAAPRSGGRGLLLDGAGAGQLVAGSRAAAVTPGCRPMLDAGRYSGIPPGQSRHAEDHDPHVRILNKLPERARFAVTGAFAHAIRRPRAGAPENLEVSVILEMLLRWLAHVYRLLLLV
jgi:hypothetical protein